MKGMVEANSPQKYSCCREGMHRVFRGSPDILLFIEWLLCTCLCKHHWDRRWDYKDRLGKVSGLEGQTEEEVFYTFMEARIWGTLSASWAGSSREREATWKYELSTLVLPDKGTWIMVIRPFPPPPSSGGTGAARGREGSQTYFYGGIYTLETWRLKKRNPSENEDLGRSNISRTIVPPSIK